MYMGLLILFLEELLGEGPELKYHCALGKRSAKTVVLLGCRFVLLETPGETV